MRNVVFHAPSASDSGTMIFPRRALVGVVPSVCSDVSPVSAATVASFTVYSLSVCPPVCLSVHSKCPGAGAAQPLDGTSHTFTQASLKPSTPKASVAFPFSTTSTVDTARSSDTRFRPCAADVAS